MVSPFIGVLLHSTRLFIVENIECLNAGSDLDHPFAFNAITGQKLLLFVDGEIVFPLTGPISLPD